LRSPSARLATLGVAVRPTLLFVVAFALTISPHEAAHATVAYLLGFSSTLFQMWVNPDAASATPGQLAVIAAAGPVFSLTVGVISWLLYEKIYKWRPAGLFFLMMAVVGIYSFLGPAAGAAFGGDFNLALTFLGISRSIQIGTSASGLVLLSLFMFCMGRPLSCWAPSSFGRAKSVVYTTVAPWLAGTVLILLVYWPLPRFLVISTLLSSVFWVFAVMGATSGFSRTRAAHPTSSLTGPDVIVTVAAMIMVRVLTHGIRLAH
jgi:hypothetical protein